MANMIRSSVSALVHKADYIARRSLPKPGDILVKPGETVNVSQIVGNCDMPGDKAFFNLAMIMGVSSRSIPRYMQVQIGQEVEVGSVIAQKKNWRGKRFFRAPIAGSVESYNVKTGELIMRRPPICYMLEAGFDGEVLEVHDQQMVDIRTTAHVLLGCFGLIKPSQGKIQVLSEDSVIEEKHIDGGCCDRIVVSKGAINFAIIRRAMSMGVKGLVAGSISAREFHKYVSAGGLSPDSENQLSVIITEGFGDYQMRDEFWDYLVTLNGVTAMMDEVGYEKEAAIVLPLEYSKDNTRKLLKQITPFKKNQLVRVIAGLNYGKLAKVVSGRMLNGDELYGETAEMILIKLENGLETAMPRWNLEAYQ